MGWRPRTRSARTGVKGLNMGIFRQPEGRYARLVILREPHTYREFLFPHPPARQNVFPPDRRQTWDAALPGGTAVQDPDRPAGALARKETRWFSSWDVRSRGPGRLPQAETGWRQPPGRSRLRSRRRLVPARNHSARFRLRAGRRTGASTTPAGGAGGRESVRPCRTSMTSIHTGAAPRRRSRSTWGHRRNFPPDPDGVALREIRMHQLSLMSLLVPVFTASRTGSHRAFFQPEGDARAPRSARMEETIKAARRSIRPFRRESFRPARETGPPARPPSARTR
jgi:hypothetical protein